MVSSQLYHYHRSISLIEWQVFAHSIDKATTDIPAFILKQAFQKHILILHVNVHFCLSYFVSESWMLRFWPGGGLIHLLFGT